jgi:hypothetical protein
MITGLLFTLAQKPLVPANDRHFEGRTFPKSVTPKAKKRLSGDTILVATAGTVSLVLALAGAVLLMAAFSTWSFDPAGGLHVQTAGLTFTLFSGAVS